MNSTSHCREAMLNGGGVHASPNGSPSNKSDFTFRIYLHVYDVTGQIYHDAALCGRSTRCTVPPRLDGEGKFVILGELNRESNVFLILDKRDETGPASCVFRPTRNCKVITW